MSADLLAFLAKYVVLPNTAARIAIALWVLHAWALDAFDVTPYLAVTSPQRRCGKTRLLEVLKVLVPRPWHAAGVTEAVLFRRIERDCPTLELDEVDTQLREKNDRAEGLRGLLNAGFERGAVVSRCVGKNLELVDFNVFCPKVLAGIGALPDTIADRSIPIAMQRKRTDEPVTRFRRREVKAEASGLRGDLEQWATEWVETLREARPEIPDALNDRQADAWEPLLAIADALGGEWPTQARAAALELADAEEDVADVGLLTLRALRDVFSTEKVMFTMEVLAALVARDDGPWAGWWGADVAAGDVRGRGPAYKLAKLLKPFGLVAGTVRRNGTTAKGYKLADCRDAFDRYLPACSPQNVTNGKTSHAAPSNGNVCDVVTGVTFPAEQSNGRCREPGEDDDEDSTGDYA